MLCTSLICGWTSQGFGKEEQECCRDSPDVCTNAKPLKCKGVSRFLRVLSLIPVTATISSIWLVSSLCNMRETLGQGTGELRTLLFPALNHRSSPVSSEFHERSDCIFSSLKLWLFGLLIPSHIDMSHNSKAATSIKTPHYFGESPCVRWLRACLPVCWPRRVKMSLDMQENPHYLWKTRYLMKVTSNFCLIY